MVNDKLDQFLLAKYINIKTYKKNKQAVLTPVWFIVDNNRIYFRTGTTTGKFKRIKNNNNVQVATCDQLGKIKGTWYNGRASIEDETKLKHINTIIDKKYGLMANFLKIFYKIKKINFAIISIDITSVAE